LSQNFGEVDSSQLVLQFGYSINIVWQDDEHADAPTLVLHLQYICIQFYRVQVAKLILFMHHVDLLTLFAVQMETLKPGVVCSKLFRPEALEVHGIHQYKSCHFIKHS